MIVPRLPPLAPKHTEERLKLAASGLQSFALALFIGVIVAPVISPSMNAPYWVRALTLFAVGALEFTAFLLLRYIPTPTGKREPPQ